MKMPAIFLGHGSPMNAVEKNQFSMMWESLGRIIPRPKAILCISAHWETKGTYVTAMENPKTIHDFGNFQQLLNFKYPAKGSLKLASTIHSLIPGVSLDHGWGFDHGTWGILAKMYPKADIPVVQLSLDFNKGPQDHYNTGRALKILRNEGVLILGSGNIVHNLSLYKQDKDAKPYDWAEEFDTRITEFLEEESHQEIIEYESRGLIARLSVPTPEHFLPLIYLIATQEKNENVSFPVKGIVGGSLSMRSVMIGEK